jgi:hypothetical protein
MYLKLHAIPYLSFNKRLQSHLAEILLLVSPFEIMAYTVCYIYVLEQQQWHICYIIGFYNIQIDIPDGVTNAKS